MEIRVPRFLIGRDEQCQLRPNSNEISRLHTAIEQREGRVFVRDLGSQIGTVLNGRVLRDEEAEASHGDRLQIEVLQFTFAIEARAASAAPHTPAEALGALFGEASTDSERRHVDDGDPDVRHAASAPAAAAAAASPSPPRPAPRPARPRRRPT